MPLEIRGPIRSGEFDVFEAFDASAVPPVYSCVAICRRNWSPGWPALGGTRRIQSEDDSLDAIRLVSLETARQLALSMYIKNSLLRFAESAVVREQAEWKERTSLFGWQGGKGVVWSPPGPLDPTRLLHHGRLIQSIGGEYFGSKDQGVGATELEWIRKSTAYIVGDRCGRDTGEGTAAGVLAGIYAAAREEGLLSGPRIESGELLGPTASARVRGASPVDSSALTPAARSALGGLSVLVVGAGKVGMPLLKLLADRGAAVYVYDAGLEPEKLEAHFQSTRARGAAVSLDHLQLLRQLRSQGRIFADERLALEDPRIQVLSPNGGPTGWLSAPDDRKLPRYEILAQTVRRGGALRIVLGAGNDQLPAGTDRGPERDLAVETLASTGITFVPDPIVSPGGVIAVSHELAEAWDGYRVMLDAVMLVQRSVEALHAKALELAADNGSNYRLESYASMEALGLSTGFAPPTEAPEPRIEPALLFPSPTRTAPKANGTPKASALTMPRLALGQDQDSRRVIVVTGGAGFIGSHLVEDLARDPQNHVISIDNYSTGSEDNHVAGVDYRRGHTKDIATLVPETPAIVFHLGEYSRVEQSLAELGKVLDSNGAGTAAVIEFCLAKKPKLVYVGSSTKFTKGMKGADLCPYSWTKAANTELIQECGKWYGLNYAIAYCYNVYGPREICEGTYATVVGIFRRQFERGEALTVVEPGMQRRNFTHVKDVVRGLVAVAESGHGDGYALGCEESISILDLANLFHCQVDMIEKRQGNRMDAALDLTKVQELGWRSELRLEDYITEILASSPPAGRRT